MDVRKIKACIEHSFLKTEFPEIMINIVGSYLVCHSILVRQQRLYVEMFFSMSKITAQPPPPEFSEM